MHDIVVSYSRDDNVAIRELVALFEKEGWSTFFDRDVAVGRVFADIIDAEIMAARCVVVVWSRSSIDSDWVRGEAYRALERKVIVPVVLADVQVPLPFNSIESIGLINWPSTNCDLQIRRLLSAVRGYVENVEEVDDQKPIRDDPTLSGRVARRVIDALALREDTRFNYERMLVEIERASLMDPATAAHRLVQGLHDCLGCRAKLTDRNGVVCQAPSGLEWPGGNPKWQFSLQTAGGRLTLLCQDDTPPDIQLSFQALSEVLEDLAAKWASNGDDER